MQANSYHARKSGILASSFQISCHFFNTVYKVDIGTDGQTDKYWNSWLDQDVNKFLETQLAIIRGSVSVFHGFLG